MTLGESAGRTRGNPVRPAARRRMTEAERAQFTHVKDDPQAWPHETNTVMTVSGRILGLLILMFGTVVCWNVIASDLILPLRVTGGTIMLTIGMLIPRVISWETTRRL